MWNRVFRTCRRIRSASVTAGKRTATPEPGPPRPSRGVIPYRTRWGDRSEAESTPGAVHPRGRFQRPVWRRYLYDPGFSPRRLGWDAIVGLTRESGSPPRAGARGTGSTERSPQKGGVSTGVASTGSTGTFSILHLASHAGDRNVLPWASIADSTGLTLPRRGGRYVRAALPHGPHTRRTQTWGRR